MEVSQLVDKLEKASDREFRDVVKSACYRRSRTLAGSESTATVVLECLHDLCNGSEREVGKAWWNVWSKEHRTIQQSVVRVFVDHLRRWVKEWTAGGWVPDARNEGAYNLAKSLSEQDIYLPYI